MIPKRIEMENEKVRSGPHYLKTSQKEEEGLCPLNPFPTFLPCERPFNSNLWGTLQLWA